MGRGTRYSFKVVVVVAAATLGLESVKEKLLKGLRPRRGATIRTLSMRLQFRNKNQCEGEDNLQ